MNTESVTKNLIRRSKFPRFLRISAVVFVAIFTFVMYSLQADSATAPSTISYQGKLLVSGFSASTTQQMYFILYDSLSGGSILYTASGTVGTPTYVNVTPVLGLFTVDLGGTGTNALDPNIFKDNTNIYLEVRIGAETLTPRKKITATPYAFNSRYLDGVAPNTNTNTTYIPLSDSSGNFNFNNVTSTGANISGLLSVVGNSYFGTIASGTWNGSLISNARGGTGADSSGWTGFVKVTAGVWATSTLDISSSVSGTLAIAYGGTGTSTAPTLGQLLMGNASGGYNLVATSTLVGTLGTMAYQNANAVAITGGTLTGLGTVTIDQGHLNVYDNLYINDGDSDTVSGLYLSSSDSGVYLDSNEIGQYFITTSGTLGQLWSSDGSGRGTWVATSSLGLTGSSLGGFTAGSIIFASSTGILTQDNPNFYWDDTNNRLGIGTTTPIAKVHVIGDPDTITIAAPASVGDPPVATYAAKWFYVATGLQHNIRVYSYQDTSSGRIYSSTYATLGSNWTDNNGGIKYYIDWTWDAVSGADGYRVLKYDTSHPYNYDYYTDVTTNALVDGGDTVWSASPTMTPTSALGFAKALRLGYDAANYVDFKIDTDSALEILNSAGTGIIHMTANGKVSIAKTDPEYTLDVNGTINIPQTSGTSTGIIYMNGVRFISSPFASSNYNVFVGQNSGMVTSTGFGNVGIGENALTSIDSGTYNVAVGTNALYNNTTGEYNVAVGTSALVNNVTGTQNVAVGASAMNANVSGGYNTAVGQSALSQNLASYNTAVGNSALSGNTTGEYNVAGGAYSLYSNTTGQNNTAGGYRSLYYNTSTNDNTAFGFYAMGDAAPAAENTAVGSQSLRNNTGVGNTAVGYASLYGNVGDHNTANGNYALYSNSEGDQNAGFGYEALKAQMSGSNNVAFGYRAGMYQANGSTELAVASGSIYIGANARGYNNSDNNTIVIGANAIGLGANTVVLGNNNITTTSLKGYVGIGTTAPLYKLTVAGDLSVTGTIRVGNSADAGTGGFILMSNGASLAPTWVNTSSLGIAVLSLPYTGVTGLTAGSVVFASSTGALTQDNSNLFWDDADNRLGIGTATPVAALDVYGKIAVSGTPFIYLPNQSVFTGTVYIGNGNGGASLSHTTGFEGRANTFVGLSAGGPNTTGYWNTALGANALLSIEGGFRNTAIGANTLSAATSSNYNTAVGGYALNHNTSGYYNTAIGGGTLYFNTSGYRNAAIGEDALGYNTTGNENTAVGVDAMGGDGIPGDNSITGDNNTAIGNGALFLNDSGDNNTAVGYYAGYDKVGSSDQASVIDNNMVFLGMYASRDSSVASTTILTNGIAIGYDAKVLGSNMVVIGNDDIIKTILKGNVGIGTTTPTFKLTIEGGVYASGTYGAGETLTADGEGTRMFWYPRKSAFRAGSVTGTQWSDANIGAYSVAFGANNTASGMGSSVFGAANTSSAIFSFVGGGYVNGASGNYSFVGGGNQNIAGAAWSFVGGGAYNDALDNYALVAGGYRNKATNDAAAIVGGRYNTSSGQYSFVGGGQYNEASNSDSFVGGGRNNKAAGTMSFIGGGQFNYTLGLNTFIGGGQYNTSTNNYSFIAGGQYNINEGGTSFITGYGNAIGAAAEYGAAAIGYGAAATANTSIAIGTSVSSTAVSAFALGTGITVSGENSFGVNVSTTLATLSQANTIALMGGNVGINTTTPAFKLTVVGDMSVTGTLRVGDSADAGTSGYILRSNGSSAAPTWVTTSSLGLPTGTGLLGHVAFWSGTSTLSYDSGDLYWDTVYRKLGVGTSSPRETLDVYGKIAINGTPFIFVPNQTTYGGTMYVGPDAAGGGGSSLEAGAVGNVYVGRGAGWSNTSGDSNTGIGQGVMGSNTTGQFNTAVGLDSLQFNTIGNGNTALGEDSLNSNVNGGRNTSIGLSTLRITTSSSGNVAVGFGALYSDFASSNTAVGFEALTYNSTGALNVALGYRALYSNTTSFANTAVGFQALRANTGASNTAIGYNAGDTLTTGNLNVIIGSEADVDATVSGAIVIGAGASASLSNQAVIGTTALVSSTIYGDIYLPEEGTASGYLCITITTGEVARGTTCDTSDSRLKKDVVSISASMNVLNALEQLRGVYYYWDTTNPAVAGETTSRQVGMIAQEVQTVLPELVEMRADGYYGLNYKNYVGFLTEVAKAQQNIIEPLAAALNVVTSTRTLTIGSSTEPYSLNLTGDVNFISTSSSEQYGHKLSFSTSTTFESSVNNSLGNTNAFIMNAVNFNTSTQNNYILSLRSNNSPVFSVSSNGDVITTGNIYASSMVLGTSTNPGDLAERVDINPNETVEAGDVMMVDPNYPDQYQKTNMAYEPTVAGVISTNPTIIVGNGKTNQTAPLAMVGRVPVKITTINGLIKRGDLLVASNVPGTAMKYDPANDDSSKIVGIIGIALDNAGDSNTGKVMALIRTGWVYNKTEAMVELQNQIGNMNGEGGELLIPEGGEDLTVSDNNGTISYSGVGHLNLSGNALINVSYISSPNNAWAINEYGLLIAKVTTSEGDKNIYGVTSESVELQLSGSAALVNGEAKITFATGTQEIIDENEPIRAIPALTSGDCQGIFVSEKSAQGFTVKELNNGTSSSTFDWIVIAKRKMVNLNIPDYSAVVADTSGDMTTAAETVTTTDDSGAAGATVTTTTVDTTTIDTTIDDIGSSDAADTTIDTITTDDTTSETMTTDMTSTGGTTASDATDTGGGV